MSDNTRREFILTAGVALAAATVSTGSRLAAASPAPAPAGVAGAGSGLIQWYSTNQSKAWQSLGGAGLVDSLPGMFDQCPPIPSTALA